jgi:hypothetical protein
MVPPQVNESADLLLSSGELPACIDGTAFYALVRLIFHVILQDKTIFRTASTESEVSSSDRVACWKTIYGTKDFLSA